MSIHGFPTLNECAIQSVHVHFFGFAIARCKRTLRNSLRCVRIKAFLHQASGSMLQQLCNHASDTVLIGNNGVTRKRVATPIRTVSLSSRRNFTALTLTIGVNGPLNVMYSRQCSSSIVLLDS